MVIDTRSPDNYAAGHIAGAVNMFDIFTYLAMSTKEGMAELKGKFTEAFGAAGVGGDETVVFYEGSMNSGFGMSCRGYLPALVPGLLQGACPARRPGRVAGGGHAGDDRGSARPRPRRSRCRVPAST